MNRTGFVLSSVPSSVQRHFADFLGFIRILRRSAGRSFVSRHVGIIATAIIAHFAFRDPLNWRMWLGMAIMIAGIIVLQWGSHTAVR